MDYRIFIKKVKKKINYFTFFAEKHQKGVLLRFFSYYFFTCSKKNLSIFKKLPMCHVHFMPLLH